MASTAHLRHLALVSESNLASMSDLLKVSAALQKQATRDLAPIWEISATVDAFAKLEDVPDGYWPMLIMDNIEQDGAEGIHLDRDGQPFALITARRQRDRWALTASHEMCEMLVDPSGNRQVTGDSPKAGQGRVSFVVEVCDPSEAADFSYTVNGIMMSDFYTPHYFDPVAASGVRYSFTGAITAPRQVLRGGYLSWLDPASGDLWQETWFEGGAPTFVDLGSATAAAGNLRGFIDRQTQSQTIKAIERGRVSAQFAGLDASYGEKSSSGNAERWREQIQQIRGRRKGGGSSRGARRKK